jgi:hypothetical protein
MPVNDEKFGLETLTCEIFGGDESVSLVLCHHDS